jgi:ATP-binding cassette, subfamily B, bacterial PglK
VDESLRCCMAAKRIPVVETLQRILWLVGRDNPARWAAVVVGAALASALEMLGALLIYLLLGLIAGAGASMRVPFIGDLRSILPGGSDEGFLLQAAGVIGLFFLLRAAYFVVFGYVKSRLAQNAGERLSSRLAEGYLSLPYAFHLGRNSAELVRNAHTSIEHLSHQAFLALIQLIAESFVILGLIALMLAVAPAATGVAVAIVGGAAVVLLLAVQPRLRDFGREAEDARKTTLSVLQQALHGIRDVQIFGARERFLGEYRSNRRALARSLYLRDTIIELPRLVIETSLIAFILLLFAWNVARGTATEELFATLGLFAYAGLRIQPSLQKLVNALNSIRFSGAAVDYVRRDLEVIEAARHGSVDADATFERELRLEDVTFSYEASGQPAVRSINLTLRPGEVIGICGPTGGGKTTLTDLVVGLLDPTQGRVTLDGVDLRECRTSWFANLGVVPQMVFLLDATIRRNVALAEAESEVDDRRLEEALRLARLDELVASMPEGVETVVGERGIRLSGGQRQRIAIARALYRQPDVLIFDEGTSALDSVTEHDVMEAVYGLREGRTVLLIAHRISSLKHCDRILYVENGEIRGDGSYESLQRENPGFQSLLHAS